MVQEVHLPEELLDDVQASRLESTPLEDAWEETCSQAPLEVKKTKRTRKEKPEEWKRHTINLGDDIGTE